MAPIAIIQMNIFEIKINQFACVKNIVFFYSELCCKYIFRLIDFNYCIEFGKN